MSNNPHPQLSSISQPIHLVSHCASPDPSFFSHVIPLSPLTVALESLKCFRHCIHLFFFLEQHIALSTFWPFVGFWNSPVSRQTTSRVTCHGSRGMEQQESASDHLTCCVKALPQSRLFDAYTNCLSALVNHRCL